jgi:drug/metabolite transporter (DMT)-like permease
MATAQTRRGARGIIGVGHLLVGGAALVFAGVMIVTGADSGAELGGVFLPLGLLLALAAGVFTYTAATVLRRRRGDRYGPSLILSIVELLAGAALASGLIVAVQSYGDPWRSPLLPPSVLLVALGLAGLVLELPAPTTTPPTH